MDTQTIKTLAKGITGAKKPLTLVQEPVLLADGSTMKPLAVTNSSDVLRVSLLMLFKHVADIHVSLVEIVADKFGLKIEDIHKAINEDPRWAAMFVHPLITDLTATIEEHSVPAPGPKAAEAKPKAAEAKPKAAKPRKPRSKKAAPLAVPAPPAQDDEELVFNDTDELVFE